MPDAPFGRSVEKFLKQQGVKVDKPKKKEEPVEDPEHAYWITRIADEFGVDVMFKAQNMYGKRWSKMQAKEQYEVLKQQKETANYDPA